jgi:SAM-dependent methyltransferase
MEAWQPNLLIAAKRLRPLNSTVLGGTADAIPASEAAFDLVLNRHGALHAAEVARVLTPGGRLLTQQVGTRNDVELNIALGAPVPDPQAWTLAVAVNRLRRCGFRVLDAREEMIDYVFHDIGAVVFQLRAVPWQIRDFNPERYERPLQRLHERICAEGAFTVHNHRFLIEAALPDI